VLTEVVVVAVLVSVGSGVDGACAASGRATGSSPQKMRWDARSSALRSFDMVIE
jgi:hypothetical protein